MRTILTLAVLVSIASWTVANDWPSFRGPKGDGKSTETEAPLEWSKKSIKWSAPLPRPGNGSPIVSLGRMFVTCAQDEKGHERSLYCFDRKDGKQLWMKTVTYEKDDPTHETNMYCGSTPAADGKRVVVWHGSGGLYCYDFNGEEKWHKGLGEFRHMWGYGSSPVIDNDRVILFTGPGETIFIAAYSLADGNELWKHEEPQEGNGEYRSKDKAYMGSWTTPIIATIDGQPQAVCTLPTRVASFDVKTGKEVWSCDGIRGPKGDLAYSSPLIAESLCVSTGGFGGPSICFNIGGSGNVTEKQRLWRKEANPQSIGTGVLVDGYWYRPNAGPNTIECIDPKTGDVKWTERAGSYWGSIVYVAGRCYATSQDGTTVVFRPTPEKFEVLARNTLGEPSNSTPAISDGEFFLRTMKGVHCIGQ